MPLRKIIIGVMGPGNAATKEDVVNARKLGRLIAQEGWILLTGGRNKGVMDEASKGAKEANGLTIGIMPTANPDEISEGVDIAIITEMKSARNNINVLSSDIVIACGMGAGTASEVALALKNHKKVVLLNKDGKSNEFFKTIGKEAVYIAENPEKAVELTKALLKQ